jgi:hypothetical protein
VRDGRDYSFAKMTTPAMLRVVLWLGLQAKLIRARITTQAKALGQALGKVPKMALKELPPALASEEVSPAFAPEGLLHQPSLL